MNLAARIVTVLNSEQARMTTSYLAVVTSMGASHRTCRRYVLKALDELMEMKVVAADKYKTGYAYRMASVPSNAEVREIKFGRPRKTTVTNSHCNQPKNV